MKQSITKEQWDELSDLKKDSLLLRICNCDGLRMGVPNDGRLPNIGQLIEFLGYDLLRYDKGNSNGEVAWALLTKDGKQITSFELIDALWEAVKYKLRG